MAAIWAQLMDSCYERFATHGCDWGAHVTALLALDHPEVVVGAHMGMVSLSGRGGGVEVYPGGRGIRGARTRWREEEHGYVAVSTAGIWPMASTTRPRAWPPGSARSGATGRTAAACPSRRSPGRPPHRHRDLLFTGTIGTASRLYRETRLAPVRLGRGTVEVPVKSLSESPGDLGSRAASSTPLASVRPRERRANSTSIDGPWSITAATSPPSRSQRSSWTKSAPSSARCGDLDQRRCRVRAARPSSTSSCVSGVTGLRSATTLV